MTLLATPCSGTHSSKMSDEWINVDVFGIPEGLKRISTNRKGWRVHVVEVYPT